MYACCSNMGLQLARDYQFIGPTGRYTLIGRNRAVVDCWKSEQNIGRQNVMTG